MTASHNGAPAPTKFSPTHDQSTVTHLRMTVRGVSRVSHDTVALYIACGVGFTITVHGPEIPDFKVGDSLIGEYPKGNNPLNTHFTAVYPASMRPQPQKEKPMTEIIAPNSGTSISMSSREIAELTGKRHDHVLRDIRSMLSGLYGKEAVATSIPTQDLKEKFFNFLDMGLPEHSPKLGNDKYQGVTLTRDARGYIEQFKLDHSHTMTLVSGYEVKLRKAIIDRWQQLEKQLANQQPAAPAIPQTLPEALRLAADLAEQKQIAEAERDEAVRTKALIGSKREATAMAAASAAKREAEKLRDQLGRNSRHATITAVEQVTGQKFPRNAYVPMRRWCKERGVSPAEVFDERYGMVKAWPAGAWLAVHDIDLQALFGTPARKHGAPIGVFG